MCCARYSYDPYGCGRQSSGGGGAQIAQAAHLDLGLITVTPRGSAAGLELLQANGSWVMAEAVMGQVSLCLCLSFSFSLSL